jgi:hypothetical protein
MAMTGTLNRRASSEGLAALLCLAVAMLAGCGRTPPSIADRSSAGWLVLERIGAARIESGRAMGEPLPGETLANGTTITTGRSAQLIVSGDGIQLTAGADTSLTLGSENAPNVVRLDRGRLRLRLAAAVDRGARIDATGLAISAASSVLTLESHQDRAHVAVESGEATVATADGRYRANLTAGAAARTAFSAGGALMVQSASGRGFVEAAPLRAAIKENADGASRAALDAQNVRASTAIAAAAPAIALVPASRPKPMRSDKPAGPDAAGATASSNRLVAATQAVRPDALSNDIVEPIKTRVAPTPTRPREEAPDRSGGYVRPAVAPHDRLQAKFDRLTEGLIEGLPRASNETTGPSWP